jgi:hypothetical protein
MDEDVYEVDAEMSLSAIVDAICADPVSLQKISLAIRDTQTKQARRMGNLYGQWAQQQ